MQVMWNAVFFDTIADYLYSWRKRKIWSHPKPQPSTNGCKYHAEKIELEAVSTDFCIACLIFFFGLSCTYNDHTIILQLVPKPGFPERNADGYNQFGVLTTKINHPNLFLSPSRFEGGNLLKGQNVSSPYNDSKDLSFILESVENELHFSSKASFADYIRHFVEKEVEKLVPFPEENKLNEVT